MKNHLIRIAEQSDLAAIHSIYAPYITDTSITFEYIIPEMSDFKTRMLSIMENYPLLVYELDQEIAGYCYANRLFARAAYQWNAELSIYLRPNQQGNGIGRRLYRTLIELLKLQNIKNIYGIVTVPNASSENLHLSLNFRELCVYRNVGFKFGHWHDVKWYEKNISTYDTAPDSFLPISELDPGLLTQPLLSANTM